jgi:L-2-hydroxyglutarate oxidase LhgO
MYNTDFLVIGAGIVGLSIARELKIRYPGSTTTVLEKEAGPGLHSSGRNSGVLHSGIYYPSDSLKAKVCSQGAIEMAEFCNQHGLPLERRGKVLVAVNEQDEPQLELLARRAADNKIIAEVIDRQTLKEIEPEARTAIDKALFIPSTAVGDPLAVMRAITSEVKELGVEINYHSKIVNVNISQQQVQLQNGKKIGYGHVVNASGLYADSVAHQFDVGQRYTLLPFKGIYWKIDPSVKFNIRHLIYPVPDLRVPFLGVHTTTTTDGTTYLGPTAVPAFGRENYHGLHGVSFLESIRIMNLLTKQFIYNRDGFRQLVFQEGRHYFKPWFFQSARAILPRLKQEHLLPSSKVGIRAQILDKKTGRMVNDFLVERGHNSTHILNAISPAWTSAFPFSRYVCDNFIEK